MEKHPYARSSGPPKMLPSYVCYADILGYGQLSREAIRTGKGPDFLDRLRHALTSAYERVRRHSKGIGESSFYAIKVFTDNIVVGYPLFRPNLKHGEPELGDIMDTFQELQAGLSMEGFFLRGGIAFGEHYQDEDIVFGEALLEAVELDQGGGAPRLSLAPSAITMVRKQLGFYAEPEWARHHHDLLEDADGTIFLNYLNQAFIAYADGGVFFELIEGHKRSVTKGLENYKGKPGIRAKYEWAARYHNYVCRCFAAEHPIPHSPYADEVSALAAEEAQKLLDFLIDLEKFAAEPKNLSLHPIKRQYGKVKPGTD